MAEYRIVNNPNGGPALGVSSIGIIEKDGYYFRDCEKTGELLPYEDWRLSPEERARDLASRAESIGQGDFREKNHPNRSYLGKSNTPANESDLDAVINTKKAMGDKPVVVVIRMNNPCIVSEFEEYADAILVNFGVETRAALTIVSGGAEPSGLLPVQLPKDMETVEKHCEDVPFDMEAYRDSCGNTYDFGFGLDWSGVIRDGRWDKYVR